MKYAIDHKRTLVVDDFGQQLHYSIVNCLIDLFNESAQLLFSTNQVGSLCWYTNSGNNMQNDQFILLTKQVVSHKSCKLSDYSNLTRQDLLKVYIQGRIGGQPKIDNLDKTYLESCFLNFDDSLERWFTIKKQNDYVLDVIFGYSDKIYNVDLQSFLKGIIKIRKVYCSLRK